MQLHALSARRPYIDMLLLTKVFSGRKYPNLLDIVGLLMPGRRFRDFGCFLMLAVKVESVLPMEAIWQQTTSAVILIYVYIVEFQS